MCEISNITKKLLEFRDVRDWEQFHDSKNLASALAIEAAELNELYLWKNDLDEIEGVDKDRLSEELADVLAYALLLAHKNNLDVQDILTEKIKKNNFKYPVKKSRGSSKKYTEL